MFSTCPTIIYVLLYQDRKLVCDPFEQTCQHSNKSSTIAQWKCQNRSRKVAGSAGAAVFSKVIFLCWL